MKKKKKNYNNNKNKNKNKYKKWMMIKTVALPNDIVFRERVKCRLPVENKGYFEIAHLFLHKSCEHQKLSKTVH